MNNQHFSKVVVLSATIHIHGDQENPEKNRGVDDPFLIDKTIKSLGLSIDCM